MRCYSGQHRFYCGVDRHARSLFAHVLDHKGRTVFAQDLPANPKAFLRAIRPYRKDLVVGVECMFAWYWLADLCEDESIPFALGHAQLLAHVVNTNTQFNLPPLSKKLTYAANRTPDLVDRFTDPGTRLMVAADLAMIDHYDEQIAELERTWSPTPRWTTRSPSACCGPFRGSAQSWG